MTTSGDEVGTAVAVIGMAGRFPGARSVDELWRNLCEGREAVTFFSEAQLRAAGVADAELRDPAYVPARAVVEDVELFDAEFFGFGVRDAEILDPQHRIFLECAWEAVEHAGYDTTRYDGHVGVYAGSAISTYLLALLADPALVASVGGYRILLANDKDHLTTRVAHKLDLRGPAVTVQTACSTSLVAVHLGTQALLARECDMVLAGGVAVSLPQVSGYRYEPQGIMSPDGHCRAFDAAARGTVAGNGAGVVVLKRLADALADGDTVHAVILGSAVNNDGAGKSGYTAPSARGQADVVAEALDAAGVAPGTVGYVEAHGTGTGLGDPIEVAALAEAMDRVGGAPECLLGSVKTNIGHLDAAAGVSGLIKAVLALREGVVPGTLHFDRPNPQARLAEAGFTVHREPRAWPHRHGPRRAGVSSFGMGGTNAHVVLQEPPRAPAPGPGRPGRDRHVIVLSAASPAALAAAEQRLAAHLVATPQQPLADVAYTLQVGRRAHRFRRAVVGESAAAVCAALAAPDGAGPRPSAVPDTDRGVVFMFPGQGAQRAGMAAGLYAREPLVREIVDECAGLLRAPLGVDLRDALLHGAGDLRDTALAQPALFTVEYALAQLWMSWGVRPEAMIGHSIGEYVAACLAGVFDLKDALELVAARGRLVAQLPPGAMLSVALPAAELAELAAAGDGLAVAAVNGPRVGVLSGPVEAVEAVAAALAARGVPARRLHTSHAFHSPVLDPVLDAFTAIVAALPRRAPQLPYVSNVTGGWIGKDEATDPAYWARQLRGTVRFADGVRTLLADGPRVLLEVGPGDALGALAAGHDGEHRPVVVATLPATDAATIGGSAVSDALARLWSAGVPVDWRAYHGTARRRRVPLPTYPFQRRRYWVEHRPGALPVPTAAASTAEPGAVAPPAAVAPPPDDPGRVVTPPGSDLERALVELWTELLGAQPIGIHDAFLDLGGHSLLATQLTARLHDRFGVAVTVEQLFALRTVARLAGHVEELLIARLEALSDDEVARLAADGAGEP
ncbi:beta-ketoacyl synthase N-terminal-like domain-containing protein [Dactylosporangium sp. NPDC000555]|uniref:type I polyketide synthase n=1 Tax=Dactylosporangium sp. NPDC000555 TaxID=3154260 RepID=UPI003326EB2C